MGNITNVGKNLMRDEVQGVTTDAQIKYIAWGDNNTANPDPNNLTQLYNELGRHAVTSRTAGGVGILDTIIYLAPADAVAGIKEIGLFAGAAATAAANSGIMVTRFLYDKNKLATESIQVVQTDTFTEA